MNDRQTHSRNFKTAIAIACLNFITTFFDVNNFKAAIINLDNHTTLITSITIPLISMIVVTVGSYNILKYFKFVRVKNAYASKIFAILSLFLSIPIIIITTLIIFAQLEVILIPPESVFNVYVQFMTNTTFDFLNNYIPNFLRFKYFYLIVGKGLAIVLQSIATIIKEKYVLNKDKESSNKN